MVNKNIQYQSISMTENTLLDDDYKHVIIEQDMNDTGAVGVQDDEVQEIYDTNMIQSTDTWRDDAIRFLIYSWSKLREQFKNCPDQTKTPLWEIVSERMVEQGFYFDAQSCETKWRLLKKMYVYSFNKINVTHKDVKPIKVWNYYYDMDKAIKGIPYEINENDDGDDDDDDNDLKDENCVTTVSYTSVTNEDKCHWTIDATKGLIQLYSKNRNKFLAVNLGGKHMLWQEISQQLSCLGYQYSATLCNDKWRNLKMTYKRNKQRELKYGIQQVKWFYFKEIDSIFFPGKYEDRSQEFDDVITVSLPKSNELEHMEKDHGDNNMDYHVTNESIVDNNEGEDNLASLETWTEAATKYLIELWGTYRQRFMIAAQGKKRLLWNETSEKLREKGHNYSGLVCDRKWRLLKANYLKRREKYKKLGMGSVVKWQYYYDIDRLLGVPAGIITWNMESTMCLIDAFDHHKEKFMKAATGEKLLIWKQISDEMAQHNFHYSARACDNKWRTLKNRYNKNKIRFNRNKKVIWIYYKKIDKVLKEVNRERNHSESEAPNCNVSNQSNEDVELDEHNYIRTTKADCSLKKEAIAELKDMFRLRNIEFDQRLKEMEDDLNNREKMFQNLQQQTLDALKKSNELEVHKLKLLEQLVSRLPPV